MSDVHVGHLLSDYAFVTISLDISKPQVQHTWTTSSNWRNLSLSEFETDLITSKLCSDLPSLDGTSAAVDKLTALWRSDDVTLGQALSSHEDAP